MNFRIMDSFEEFIAMLGINILIDITCERPLKDLLRTLNVDATQLHECILS